FLRNRYAFSPQFIQCFAHQVAGAQRVMETGMYRTGVNKVRRPHLPDVPQPLKPWMVYQLHYFIFRKPYKTIYGVVHYLTLLIHTVVSAAKFVYHSSSGITGICSVSLSPSKPPPYLPLSMLLGSTSTSQSLKFSGLSNLASGFIFND